MVTTTLCKTFCRNYENKILATAAWKIKNFANYSPTAIDLSLNKESNKYPKWFSLFLYNLIFRRLFQQFEFAIYFIYEYFSTEQLSLNFHFYSFSAGSKTHFLTFFFISLNFNFAYNCDFSTFSFCHIFFHHGIFLIALQLEFLPLETFYSSKLKHNSN